MAESGGAHDWTAPGYLESVRVILNTWDFSPRTGNVTDRLRELAQEQARWDDVIPGIRRPRGTELEQLVQARDAVRALVERDEVEAISVLMAELSVTPRIVTNGPPEVSWRGNGPGGDLIAYVMKAITDRSITRLRSCPGCRLVFFDRSRNGSKRWCGMYAGRDGRACGSIMKVRRWRDRHRGEEETSH